jgi:hypothetical protein
MTKEKGTEGKQITVSSTKGSMQKYNHNTVFNFIPM